MKNVFSTTMTIYCTKRNAPFIKLTEVYWNVRNTNTYLSFVFTYASILISFKCCAHTWRGSEASLNVLEDLQPHSHNNNVNDHKIIGYDKAVGYRHHQEVVIHMNFKWGTKHIYQLMTSKSTITAPTWVALGKTKAWADLRYWIIPWGHGLLHKYNCNAYYCDPTMISSEPLSINSTRIPSDVLVLKNT